MELNEILKVAIKVGASDIHLKSGLPPLFHVCAALSPPKYRERILPHHLPTTPFSLVTPPHNTCSSDHS